MRRRVDPVVRSRPEPTRPAEKPNSSASFSNFTVHLVLFSHVSCDPRGMASLSVVLVVLVDHNKKFGLKIVSLKTLTVFLCWSLCLWVRNVLS